MKNIFLKYEKRTSNANLFCLIMSYSLHKDLSTNIKYGYKTAKGPSL